MKNFQRGGFRGGDNRDRQMFQAICSNCGKPCEVPFKPTGDKPVFCNDCFNKKRDPSDTRMSRPEFSDRAPKRDFSRPDPRAPYKPAQENNNLGKQLSDISAKLDRLISMMEKNPPAGGSKPKTETLKQVLDKVVAKKKTPPPAGGKKKVAKKKK